MDHSPAQGALMGGTVGGASSAALWLSGREQDAEQEQAADPSFRFIENIWKKLTTIFLQDEREATSTLLVLSLNHGM